MLTCAEKSVKLTKCLQHALIWRTPCTPSPHLQLGPQIHHGIIGPSLQVYGRSNQNRWSYAANKVNCQLQASLAIKGHNSMHQIVLVFKLF